MGARFRLKASFNIAGYPAPLQMILRAMKTYGIILADNGSPWYVSGAPDPRWSNDDLHSLGRVTGADLRCTMDSKELFAVPVSELHSAYESLPQRLA